MRKKNKEIYDETEHDVNITHVLIADARETRLQSPVLVPSPSRTTPTVSYLTNEETLDVGGSAVMAPPVEDITNSADVNGTNDATKCIFAHWYLVNPHYPH